MEIRRCADMMADWGDLVALARKHAVAPLLLRGLRMAEVSLPDGLKDIADHAARRSLVLTGELIGAAGALAAAGVPCLTFKGPCESVLAYHNPTLRSCRDIDLIVDPVDVSVAIAVLAARGYETVQPAASRVPPGLAQTLLLRRQTQTAIDLHWRWTDLPRLYDWPFTAAFERRRSLDISGVTVCTLPDEERLLFLCLHGGLHFWDRLAWLCDLAWEHAEAGMDGVRLQQRAQQLGVGRLLQLGLSLAHRLLGMPWPEGLPGPALPPDLACLQAEIIARLVAVQERPRGRMQALASNLLLRDTWRGRFSELGYRGRRNLVPSR